MNAPQLARIAALAALASLPPVRASAHGIYGHVHVTAWAITNLPPGPQRDFFSDPEVFNAALFGAAFTDSGYWPQGGALAAASRPYSEHTHWEPFIHDFVAWIVANDPPPWDDLESRKRAAFLMGCGAHGLQDEIFDSLFLDEVETHDGGGQDSADPGTDGFLALDAHIRFVPEPYYPLETLLELYEVLDAGVTASVIERSVNTMVSIYLTPGREAFVESLGNQYSEEIPWSRDHFMDPNIPGSLRAEIGPTAAYIQALWDRLHGTFEPNHPIVATYPESGRALRSTAPDSTDTTVTMIFGEGVRYDSIATDWATGDGTAVASDQRNTRWGAEFTRLVRVRAAEALSECAAYEVTLQSGAATISGATVEGARVAVRGACGEPVCAGANLDGFPTDLPAPAPEDGFTGTPRPGCPGEGSAGGSGDGLGSGDGSGDGFGSGDGSHDGSDDAEGSPVAQGGGGCAVAPGPRRGAAAWALLGIALGLRRRRR